MTALFDGVSGLLTGVFGETVIWSGPDLAATSVEAVFRRVPVEVPGPGGEAVVALQPICRVPVGALPRPPRRGDRVQPADGTVYLVTSVQPSGSPASDRFLVCELELVP